MSSPTQRTLKSLRDAGYIAGVVEKWIPQTQRRLDLFGFIDIVAVGNGRIVGVQCTSRSNAASRVTKIKTECREAALAWLVAGGEIEVWSWRRYAKRIDRRVWRQTVEHIRRGDFQRIGE